MKTISTNPRPKSFIDTAVRPSFRIGRHFYLCGQSGIAIANNGFGGVVIRLASGEVIHLHEIQWRGELVIEPANSVLANERNKISGTNRQDTNEPSTKPNERGS